MTNTEIERLMSIKTFASLVKYFRDELDWPIDTDDFDELTFDYDPEELGLDTKTAVKIKQIKQLRPSTTGQPRGVFAAYRFPSRRITGTEGSGHEIPGECHWYFHRYDTNEVIEDV